MPPTPLTPAQEMQQRYKNTFSTSEGIKVLGDIATLGHVFDTISPDDVAKVAERNFAIVIMQMAGAFDPLYAQLGLGSEKGAQNASKSSVL